MKKPVTAQEEEEFFRLLRERITPLAKRRIKGAAYEDVVQETLMVVKTRLSGIEDEEHILPFLFQTLRNCVGNHYQKMRREQKYIDFSAETERAYEADESRDWQDVLEKALARLGRDHAKCATLLRAVMRSAETEELKKLLNADESNVYRTLYRCRNRLKEIITQVLKVKLP